MRFGKLKKEKKRNVVFNITIQLNISFVPRKELRLETFQNKPKNI